MRVRSQLTTSHTSRQGSSTKHPAHDVKNTITLKTRALKRSGKQPERAIKPTPVRPPPLLLEDLECVRTLGSGAYASVLLVRTRPRKNAHKEDRPGSLFALKVLKKVEMRNLERKSPGNTDAERQSLCELPFSPWISGIIDVFCDQLNFYLLLECVPGSTLHDVIHRRGPLDATTARFYYSNIVCALVFLHSHNIVHLDLKPANILIGPDGYITLVDFGFAKPLESSPTWSVMGTPIYMAPELFMNDSGKGYGVDWYSSGIILYEMITKQVPFYGKKDTEVYERVIKQEYEWPKHIRVGQSLKSIVAGLLTYESQDRLGVVGDVEDHRWLRAIDWNMMRGHNYLAPWIPRSDILQLWHNRPLPSQQSVPGLHVVTPPEYLRHDGRYYRQEEPGSLGTTS